MPYSTLDDDASHNKGKDDSPTTSLKVKINKETEQPMGLIYNIS